jgi:RNA polymerase sigma factor (sigma-70 family)
MTTLTKLATEYKKTKSEKVLNDIFKFLSLALKNKAKYVFYKQKFIKNKYETEVFDKETLKFKKEERVSTFRLCDTKKVELEDVEQELNLKVIELLDNYDNKLPFDNYLFGTLKYWRPDYIRKFNFIKDLDTINESDYTDTKGNNNFVNLPAPDPEDTELPDLSEMFGSLTKGEEKLLKLMIKFPYKNQQELADTVGVSQQRVCQILELLKKKYKKNL